MIQKYTIILITLTLIGIALIVGCTNVPEPGTQEKTDIVDEGVPIPKDESVTELGILDCGFEENVHGQGYNEEARSCFYNAFLECKEAKFKVTHYTIEGDPITNTFTILGKANGECKIKNQIVSEDSFGKQGTFENICSGLNKKDFNQQEWFELTSCEDMSIGFNFA